MSLSASISLSPSTIVTNQKCTASVTFTNGASDPARTITGMQPYGVLTGSSLGVCPPAINFGQANLQSTNPSVTVAASGGTSVITFDFVAFGPSTGILSNGNGTFDIGVQCQSADGQVFHPTAGTVTVNYCVSFPSSQN
jgi:hypothetical protein